MYHWVHIIYTRIRVRVTFFDSQPLANQRNKPLQSSVAIQLTVQLSPPSKPLHPLVSFSSAECPLQQQQNTHHQASWKGFQPWLWFFQLYQMSCVCFCCSRVIYFRPAYALPTPCLRRCGVFLRGDYLSWFAYACLRLPVVFWFCLRGACVCCFCGLSVGLDSSHFAYAVGASVVSWGCVFCTSGYCYTRLQTKHIQIKMQGCETPRLISQQQNTTSDITTKHFLQHRLRRKKY